VLDLKQPLYGKIEQGVEMMEAAEYIQRAGCATVAPPASPPPPPPKFTNIYDMSR
jgi:hypothetical protein